MVKNIRKYIIVALALYMYHPCTVQAQSQYDSELNISLGAGSSALKYQMEQGKSKSGTGWELGVSYAHFFSRTIGVSLGLEAEMFGSSIDMKNIAYEQQIQPPPGLSGFFLLQADYNTFKEKQTAVMLQIPVMLQFQFPVSKKAFFFLGTGIKAGIPVSSKWNQTAQLTTTGYSEYTGQQYVNIPNHGFSTSSDVNASGKLELKSPVMLALEGGLKFGMGEGKHLYTGVFLDYGLNDIYKMSANTALLEYNNDSPANYNYKSILTTSQYSAPGGIKPFAVGIKIKIGMGLGGKKAHEPVKKNVAPNAQKPEPVWGWEGK
jgi:hypothetical protein